MAEENKDQSAMPKRQTLAELLTPEELEHVRRQIVAAILKEALTMIHSEMDSVEKHGGIMALKFLLQFAGLSPAAASGAQDHETLADALGRELGLTKKSPQRRSDENGNVES